MSADDDIAAKEAEALFKIHGVDQRSAELAFSHPALGGEDAPVRMRQDGSTSKAFVPGTSTVIWPCAYSLGDYLCDATTAYRAKLGDGVGDATEAARGGAVTADTVAVELGAGLGLGLTGAAIATLVAQSLAAVTFIAHLKVRDAPNPLPARSPSKSGRRGSTPHRGAAKTPNPKP